DAVPIQVQLLDSNARTPLSAKTEFVIRVRPASAAGGAQIASASQAVPAMRPAPPPSTGQCDTQTFSQQHRGTPAAPQMPSPRSGCVVATANPAFRAQTVPAPVPPPAIQEPVAVRRPNSRPEVEDLIREGNKRMREGDILEARQFYQKAVTLGG